MVVEGSAGGVVVREQAGALELAIIKPKGRSVWALPKGHPNPGETLEQAATREVYEETGLVVEAQCQVGEVRYIYQFRGERVFKTVTFFLFRAVGGEIDRLDPAMRVEVDLAKWIPLADAATTLTFAGERQMVEKAKAILG